MPPYGKGQEHKFFEINRWEPGVIYREKIALYPPEKSKMANVDLRVRMAVKLGDETVGTFTDSALIEMTIAGLRYPRYNTEFDDVIYRYEPGKCWTAEQLAKVTGGKWIVPPPQGWYIQSFTDEFKSKMARPSLLILRNKAVLKKNIGNIGEFVGAMTPVDLKGLPADFPLLKVADVFRAMRELGFAARKRFQGRVIAVTGSAGKTTTCNMLKHVLGKDHNVKATPGSANVYDNIPRIFANLKPNDAYAIIEMSINALAKSPGSITYDITPDVAVVTSIVPAHTGSGGSLENLAKHKRKIFCGMSPGGYAILNRDMPYYELFEQKAKSVKLNIITFGKHPDATIRMPVIANDAEFFVNGKTYKLSCSVPAEQLYDALAVIAVSIAVGFSIDRTLEYLQSFSPVKGRGNVVKSIRNGKNLTLINSAYNANPESMKYALEHLKTSEPNQKSRVAILGDIADLGINEIKYHKGLSEAMLTAETDRLLLCGKLMCHPYELVKDKINVTWFETLNKLLAEVESHLQDGDTILIKSSHATGLDKVVDLLSQSTPSEEFIKETIKTHL